VNILPNGKKFAGCTKNSKLWILFLADGENGHNRQFLQAGKLTG